jgi:hypothetical protein
VPTAQIDSEESSLLEWAAKNHRRHAPHTGELIADLASQGWRPAGSLHNHLVFEQAPSGIRMHDVHAGNFIRQKNGVLIPIDVFFEGLPAPSG